MSKSMNQPEIETLLSERARFEAWLDQLMAKSSKVPSHVAERVRGDYEARLARVVDELRSRADELRGEGNELEERLAVLESDLSARRDARAEDELRALVGEYDDVAWAEKAAEHDGGINRVESECAAAQSDLARVRDLLGEATRPSRAMHAITEAEVSSEPAPIEPEPVTTEPVVVMESVAPMDEGFTPIDEAAAVADLPVVSAEPIVLAAEPVPEEIAPRSSGTVRASEPVHVPPPPVAPPAEPAARRPSPFDEIGFLRTVVGRATPFAGIEMPSLGPPPAPPPPPAAPQSPPAPPPPPPPVAPVALPPQPSPRASQPKIEPPSIPDVTPSAPARASVPAMPAFDEPMAPESAAFADREQRDSKSMDASRSLKCQECGWMNYPTEWYCEKCGGELAAF